MKRIPAAALFVLIITVASWVLFRLPSASTAREQPTKTATDNARDVTRLENGATLILKPVKGIGRIAVESIYNVGFIDEPKGMCQAAHLLEHLVCNAPTKSYSGGEAFELLNRIGTANAETLPDWTHYDYVVPSDKLELVLKIETERLSSLHIEADVVSNEIPRIYVETDAVERFPETGMLKHAFMAFSQAWRYGEKTALVRGGLDEIPLDRLVEFHAAVYRPDRLTLVIAGDFDVEQTKQYVMQTISTIKRTDQIDRPVIDWKTVPASTTVEWDASISAVCVYFPPPEKALDRLVLSHLGTMWQGVISNDSALKKTTDMIMPSSILWSVGDLPFFFYAAAKPGVPVEQVERELISTVHQILKTPPEQMLRQIQVSAPVIAQQLQSGFGKNFQPTVDMVMKQPGMDRNQAIDMVLGQSAIWQRPLRQLSGDAADAGAAQLRMLKSGQLKAIMASTFAPENQRVIRVVPQKSR